MGLFGSKTVTTVGTSVQRMIEDELIPDSILSGWVADHQNGGGQMMEYIKDKAIDSIGLRANRMYNYGKKSYIFGVPTGQVYSSLAAKEAVKAVIESTEGPTQILYYHFGPLNNMHIAWKELTEQYGYDYQSNVITGILKHSEDGKEDYLVYLKDMRLIVTNATLEEAANGSLDQWGIAPNSGPTPSKLISMDTGSLKGATPFAVDPDASGDYVLVTYEWKIPAKNGVLPEIKTETMIIPMDGYDYLEDYHMASYVTSSGRGFYIYQHNGGNPVLDAIFDAEYNDQGNFFPWTYFRWNKTNPNDNKNSEEWKSQDKMLKILNYSYEDITTNINANPDIADVQQAIMMMGVPANTTNTVERKYLFDFFSGLYQQTSSFENTNKDDNAFEIAMKLVNDMNKSSIVLQDKRFKMALQWRNIVKRKVGGKIAAKGNYDSGANLIPSDIDVPSLDGTTLTWDTSTQCHFYRYQITDSVYEEILVYGLKMVYYIIDGYTTTGDEDNKDILLIPINISIAKGYSLQEREQLYSRSLHYVFNSVVYTKLKWYQTGVFRAFLLIVAIIITVVSYGSTWQSIGAALAAGTVALSVVLMALIQELVKYLLITLALKLFVKATNWKFAIVVAMIVAAAYSQNYDPSALTNGMLSSGDLITVSSGLVKAANAEVASDLLEITQQIEDFQEYADKELETLKSKSEDLLSQNTWMVPMVIFGETPEQFFDRTSHYGNIGVVTLDVVENYVDASLRLPNITDTIKGV